MKKFYNIISLILIVIPITIILNSILNDNEHSKILINITMIVIILIMGIIAILIRKIHDKKQK